MAERIVSPGVFTRENDLSFLAQGVGEIGAAFIGPFKQGPAFVPTIVRTQSEFEDIFGTPDGTYYTEYAVQKYLQEAGQATVVRVAGVGGYTQNAPLAITAVSASVTKIVGVLYDTENGYQNYGFANAGVGHNPTDAQSFFVYGVSGSVATYNYSASFLPSSTADIADVFGESPFGKKNAYSYLYFETFASASTKYTASFAVLENQDYTNGGSDAFSEAYTPWVVSQKDNNGLRSNLFKFHTLGHGDVYNTKFKVGISNVKAAGEDGGTDYSTFTVTVRAYSDTDKRKSVVETFNNVNLDPASSNYIARRIGDRYLTINSDGKITENGDYANKSKYIRIEMADEGSYPISAAPFGHEPYLNPIKLTTPTLMNAVVYQKNSTGNTSSSPLYYSGFDFEGEYSMDNKQYLKALPDGVAAGNNITFAFDSDAIFTGGEIAAASLINSDSATMVLRQFVLAFQGGYDGMNPIVKKAKAGDTDWSNSNTQGFDCSSGISSGTSAYYRAINAVSNPDEWDINLVATPGIVREKHPSVVSKAIDMVEDRQDCFYIADFTDYNADITTATEQANSVDSNYVATYYPWVKTVDNNTNKLTSVPPSVLLPAVFASNDRLAAEWFAPAGLNRGGISGAVSVLNRLTHAERDTLYENKVNPIAAFPGQGIVAFGQKTLQDKASALDRINVRRLLIVLKKFIASTSRYLVFEQNTATTRQRFLNTVNPYLEAVQQRQGLYAFRVVMDESNNTPDVIDRNILAGQIFLQPAKTAEFIVIDFNILPTGASFTA